MGLLIRTSRIYSLNFRQVVVVKRWTNSSYSACCKRMVTFRARLGISVLFISLFTLTSLNIVSLPHPADFGGGDDQRIGGQLPDNSTSCHSQRGRRMSGGGGPAEGVCRLGHGGLPLGAERCNVLRWPLADGYVDWAAGGLLSWP